MHSLQGNKPFISNFTGALFKGGVFACALAVSSAASANGLSIVYNFLGDNWTADEQSAMNNAASAFSQMFGSHFSNSGTITLDATAYNDASVNVLASAGSLVAYNGAGTFGGGEVVRTKLQGGIDLNGAAADGMVNVNFAYFSARGLNDPVPVGTYDFYSTLYHEYTHALGFMSSLNEAGQPFVGSRHNGTGEWATFDQYLVDATGNRVVNNSYVLQDGIWDATRTGGSTLYFNGANAVAANGGQLVNLYSPTTWSDGSSVSHLDDETPALAKMMMASSTFDGLSARNFSGIEVGMLRDLGYAVVAVPEPESYAMLLAGLGLVGFMARRRRA